MKKGQRTHIQETWIKLLQSINKFYSKNTDAPNFSTQHFKRKGNPPRIYFKDSDGDWLLADMNLFESNPQMETQMREELKDYIKGGQLSKPVEIADLEKRLNDHAKLFRDEIPKLKENGYYIAKSVGWDISIAKIAGFKDPDANDKQGGDDQPGAPAPLAH